MFSTSVIENVSVFHKTFRQTKFRHPKVLFKTHYVITSSSYHVKSYTVRHTTFRHPKVSSFSFISKNPEFDSVKLVLQFIRKCFTIVDY